MTPLDWSNLPKTTAFVHQTFNVLPFITSINDGGVLSITSKSSSSKSCTLPSVTSTKNSRLSTPTFSSGNGKSKRPLSFSPMSDHLPPRSPSNVLIVEQQHEESNTNLTLNPPRINLSFPLQLAPLDETQGVHCQWSNCDLIYSTPTQLTEHIRAAHIDRTDSRSWSCQWHSCTRAKAPFKSLYSLFLHLRTHTQDRPFQCLHVNCSKTFTRAEYLRLHERSHTGEKPYPCEYADCTKAFSNPSDRTKHVKRTHLNKKEYVCQVYACGKSYTDPSSLRKHVKTVHGEDAFQKKKHKRTNDDEDRLRERQSLDTFQNFSGFASSWNQQQHFNQIESASQSNAIPDDDDDEDVIIDRIAPLIETNVDALGNNLGELSVGTVNVLSVHRPPTVRSLKQIARRAVLPAIRITGVYELDGEESCSNKEYAARQQSVAFRPPNQHRISAQSASTAYGSMRSDSMNVDSALFAASNHSSLMSLAQHPSTSPYEFDCISNENIRMDNTRGNHALAIPSYHTSHSPLRRSNGSCEQLLTLPLLPRSPRVSSVASHLSSNFTSDLSLSSSFCVSAISGDQQQPMLPSLASTAGSNPKMAHLLYFLQTLDCNSPADYASNVDSY